MGKIENILNIVRQILELIVKNNLQTVAQALIYLVIVVVVAGAFVATVTLWKKNRNERVLDDILSFLASTKSLMERIDNKLS